MPDKNETFAEFGVARALHDLTTALQNEWDKRRLLAPLATKQDLKEARDQILGKLNEIMPKVSDAIKAYSDQVQASYDALSTSVDAASDAIQTISTAQTGVAADVAYLKALIEKLQNSPGDISAEDQKTLDDAQARVAPLVDKVAAQAVALKAAADALKALDDATEEPPTPPV